MDVVIAQTCSVVALAMVTVWAIVAAEKSREDSESESQYGRVQPRCEPDICSRVRYRTLNDEDCPPTKGTINPHGVYCGCCPACVLHISEHSSC